MFKTDDTLNQASVSTRLANFFRREWLWVGILTALSLLIHAKYRLTGFGEQDAARLARDAISWHLRGQIMSNETSYRMHTSPGYIHVLKLALDRGLPIRELPQLMNWLSVASGSVCAAVLYALFRQFSAPRYAALAVGLYSVAPGFWLGSVYGMPTIPALLAFTLSLLLFVHACHLRELRSFWLPVLILGSWLCLFWSISFKADLVLCTAAFVAAAVSVRRRRWQMLGLASFVVLGSLVASLLYVRKVLIPAPGIDPDPRSFLAGWHKQFPFKAAALLDANNSQTIINCVGGLLFSVLLMALLAALVSGGRQRNLALAALAWGAPPILFWGLSYGNHARHSVFGIAPMFLIAAHLIFRMVGERTPRAVVLALCLAGISYRSDTDSRGPVCPASNLLDSVERLDEVTQGYHRSSRALALSPSRKRAVVGAGSRLPYLDFEVFALAKQPVMVGSWELHDGPQVTIFAHTSPRRVAEVTRELQRQGYKVLTR